MRCQSWRPSGLTWLVAAMLVLLPVLAALQYRWLGQLSDAEHDRLQRSLSTNTAELVHQIDLEIARAVVGLQLDVATTRDQAWDRYAERYAVWHATSLNPSIVDAVLLVEADPASPGQLRLRQWDAAHRTFRDARWPAELDGIRARLERELHAFLRHPEPIFVHPADLLTRDASALVIPLVPIAPLPDSGAPPQLVPTFGYTIVRINQSVLEHDIVPAAVARHFGTGPSMDYHLAIVTRHEPQRVIYESEPGDAAALERRADVDKSFCGLRADQFVLLRQAAGSLRAAQPADGQRAEPRRNLFVSVFAPRRATSGDADDGSRWRLLVRHRAGSLEAAVGRARQRNLALSFGILVLMAVSVGLIVTAARRAQRLARQQIEFVAGVSHELRTPVSVINAAADNLAQGVVVDPARIRQYGGAIRTEARRLGETVERVLEFAGIQAGRPIGQRSAAHAGVIVEEAIAASRAAIEEAGATVERAFAAGVPDVLADPAALRSAIQNLIVNAVKYGGPQPRVRVRVETGRHRGAREVVVSVHDSGPGIDAADLPHVFEPFYRGANALSRQIHGNGLGLSIVARIVEAHGGRVAVASAAGAGTTFSVHLPAADRGVPTEEEPARAAHSIGIARSTERA